MSQITQGPIAAREVKELAVHLGADAVGVAPAGKVAIKEHFLAWLAAGYAADMAYLHKYQEERFDPAALLPGAQSVVVVGLNYASSEPASDGPFRVAQYAWGEDYHRVLRRLLRALRRRLRQRHPGLAGRICVDTAPFPDKYWAALAGLGWQGKHTNLVSRRHGSYLVLGSLIVDRVVDDYDPPEADYCGSCNACLVACPTSAFPKPYVLDARRCISHWTIESGSANPPPPVAKGLGAWVFGCDECLDVCPWNRFATPSSHPELKRSEAVWVAESGRVGELSEAEFARTFAGSPLTRAGRAGLIRNQLASQASVGEVT